jgi:transcriptional regulator with XRE-family HTH domain
MKKEFDIEQLFKAGEIKDELELERASNAERKLRLISKKDPKAKTKRRKLRELIYEFENKNWKNRNEITTAQIQESNKAEIIVQKESEFIDLRKKLIRTKLKKLGLNQQEFGKILGHDSKSYMSELMNGIVPFTLKDLIIISKLLRINLNKLIPTQIPEEEKIKIERKINSLGKKTIKLNKQEFAIK